MNMGYLALYLYISAIYPIYISMLDSQRHAGMERSDKIAIIGSIIWPVWVPVAVLTILWSWYKGE